MLKTNDINNRQSFLLLVFFVLFIVAITYGYGHAEQSVQVIVKDQDGHSIDKFHYNTESLLAWSESIYVREADEAPFPDYVDILSSNVIEPHTYHEEVPRILVEIMAGENLIDSAYLDERDTFNIENPGEYLVRCSTTIQVSGDTVEETTNIPWSGSMVFPTYFEDEDEKGRFEFYKVEAFEKLGQIAFRYYKRYTYQVISDTITYVSPGEEDQAFVCILRNPDALGEFQNSPESAEIDLPDPIDDSTNITLKAGLKQGIDWAFKVPLPLDGGSLLAGEVANVIYAGALPEKELKWEDIAKTGITWFAGKLICIKLGIVGGPKAFVVGVLLDIAILIPDWYDWKKLKTGLTHATVDDLFRRSSPAGDNYSVYLHNVGIPLENIRLATYSYGTFSAAPDDEYGVRDLLMTGEICEFENVRPDWFKRVVLSHYPAIIFDAFLLGQYYPITLSDSYDDIQHANVYSVDDDYTPDTEGWGVNSFAKIQDAINASEAYSLINISDGTYFENVVLRDNVSLKGESADTVILDGGNLGNHMITAAAGNIVSGLTIINSGSNNPYKWAGVFCGNGSEILIKNCVFNNNDFGVYCASGSSARIINNTLHAVHSGIECISAKEVVVINNIVSECFSGIWSWDSDVILSHNDFYGNSYNQDYSGVSPGVDDIHADPLFAEKRTVDQQLISQGAPGDNSLSPTNESIDMDYHLLPGSPCINAGHPNMDASLEPDTGNSRINIGAYGNTDEAAVRLQGDTNNDGVISLDDVIISLRLLALVEGLPAVNGQADVNRDDRIGVEDIIYIFQRLSGKR